LATYCKLPIQQTIHDKNANKWLGSWWVRLRQSSCWNCTRHIDI